MLSLRSRQDSPKPNAARAARETASRVGVVLCRLQRRVVLRFESRFFALIAATMVVAPLVVAPPTARAQDNRQPVSIGRSTDAMVLHTAPAGVTRPSFESRDRLMNEPTVGFLPPGQYFAFDGERELQFRPSPSSAVFQAPANPRATWLAPLASAAVPGAGQGLLRQQRALAYVVAESFLLLRAVRSHREYEDAKVRYRQLAADVARSSFGGPRPDGPWEYYEEMEKYESSGAYSLGGPGQLIPETDLQTFNGQQWLLARQQFWANADVPPSNPQEYTRALDYYVIRAVPNEFLWSWRDHGNEYAEFKQRIKDSNNSNQRYVTAVAVVAANHLVSLIDAYVTVRLRRYGGAGLQSASLQTKVVPSGLIGDPGYRMAMGVTIPVAGIR